MGEIGGAQGKEREMWVSIMGGGKEWERMWRYTLGGREQGVEGSQGEEVLVVTCAPSINTKAVSW